MCENNKSEIKRSWDGLYKEHEAAYELDLDDYETCQDMYLVRDSVGKTGFSEDQKEQYYNHFAPEVPMEQYFKYEERFCPENGLVGYDDFYHLCRAYDEALDVPFNDFQKKYGDYRKNCRKGQTFSEYYKYWSIYEDIGLAGEYIDFQSAMEVLGRSIKETYQKYALINEKLCIADLIPVFGMLSDPFVAENYSELLKEGIIPTAENLMLSTKLSYKDSHGFTCTDICKCLENTCIDGSLFEEWYRSYFAARPNGTLEDLCMECRYFGRAQSITETGQDKDGFSRFFKYYHKYREAGGKNGLIRFGSNILQYFTSKEKPADLPDNEKKIYVEITRECRKDPERDGSFPFCEIEAFASA